MELISMVDFVEESRKKSKVSPFEHDQNEIDSEDLLKIYKYASFLKNPVSLEMFIACDDKNNPIEEITAFDPDISSQYYASQLYHNELVKTAERKILFSGFVPSEDEFMLTVGNGKINYDSRQFHKYGVTINDLVKDNLILTKSAIKILGL